jgi:carbon-monoxide dehydrogenase medium subunit
VKSVQFAYHRPESLDEALALLERYGPDGRILAGGQSLVPALNMRLAAPAALIDINRLPGLDGISLEPEGLVIGAMTRHEAVKGPHVARRAR